MTILHLTGNDTHAFLLAKHEQTIRSPAQKTARPSPGASHQAVMTPAVGSAGAPGNQGSNVQGDCRKTFEKIKHKLYYTTINLTQLYIILFRVLDILAGSFFEGATVTCGFP